MKNLFRPLQFNINDRWKNAKMHIAFRKHSINEYLLCNYYLYILNWSCVTIVSRIWIITISCYITCACAWQLVCWGKTIPNKQINFDSYEIKKGDKISNGLVPLLFKDFIPTADWNESYKLCWPDESYTRTGKISTSRQSNHVYDELCTI